MARTANTWGHPRAWRRADMEADSGWRWALSPAARDGLLRAVDHARRLDRPILAMTADDFPLSSPAAEAVRQAFATVQGRWGVCLLSGVPVREWSEADTRLAHWGIGLHVGVARPQNAASEVINDVRDAGGAYQVMNGRGYNTNLKLDFHIDFCDVVSLLCRRTARSGGTSLVSSSLAVIDEIRREHPELAPALLEPIPFSWQGTQAPDDAPLYMSPMSGEKDGEIAFRTNRKNIVAAQRDFPHAPRLTGRQQALVELVDLLLADERFCYAMRLDEGDLQLVNNYVIVHSRTGFEDFETIDEKRHLLRLWLAVPDAQPLPDGWRDAFKDTRARAVRGGVRGQGITSMFLAYEARQAARLGMANIFAATGDRAGAVRT